MTGLEEQSLDPGHVASDSGDGPLPPIVGPYLLVLFSVPFFVDAQGRRWIDPLWAKDLVQHTRYIKNLTLAAPALHLPPPPEARLMDSTDGLREVRCVDLPVIGSRASALLWLPRTCAILWRELRGTRLVHTGVAGWPLPEAWLITPMLLLRRRHLYVNVESAFWRIVPGDRVGAARRLRAMVTERLNRMCVESADFSTFTHRGYLLTLLRRGRERGHVVEASWIDERNLLSAAQSKESIARRKSGRKPLRLLFAGRLTHAKGVLLLMDAVAVALRDGLPLELDIFGGGPLETECEARSREPALRDAVRLHGNVPYDDRFFAALRDHDVLVVPTLSDEQPRVVFDAYSQGLPVVASRTDGLLQCVEDGVTGLFFTAGDGDDLKRRLVELIGEPGRLAEMSAACLTRARLLTHRQMHWKRWKLLIERFPALTRTE